MLHPQPHYVKFMLQIQIAKTFVKLLRNWCHETSRTADRFALIRSEFRGAIDTKGSTYGVFYIDVGCIQAEVGGGTCFVFIFSASTRERPRFPRVPSLLQF